MRRGQLDKLISTVPTLLLVVLLVVGFVGLAFLARSKVSGGIEGISSLSSASLAMQEVHVEGKEVPLIYALKLFVEEKLTRQDLIGLLKEIPEAGECVYVSWGITQDYNGLLTPFAEGGTPFGALVVRADSVEVLDSAGIGISFAVRYVATAFPLSVRVTRTGQELDLLFLTYRGVCR